PERDPGCRARPGQHLRGRAVQRSRQAPGRTGGAIEPPAESIQGLIRQRSAPNGAGRVLSSPPPTSALLPCSDIPVQRFVTVGENYFHLSSVASCRALLSAERTPFRPAESE